MTMMMPYDPLATGPAGSSALIAAVEWLQGTLLGTIATTIAVIAIAFVGFRMLMGQIDVRRGATVILGCFILFGASSIAAGLRATIASDEVSVPSPPKVDLPVTLVPPTPTNVSDPYAGASVQRY